METKLCRFRNSRGEVRVGLAAEEHSLWDLTREGVVSLHSLLENDDPLVELKGFLKRELQRVKLSDVHLCAPVERQEVWAAGVTYLRSKTARMEESEFSANAYDRVYDAKRPELFFKAAAEKVVGPEEDVGIRKDARWSVPEPELALVFNSKGKIVGYTIGNDMSSRDIEGENLLYLPQAKTYARSCALGPWICLGASEAEARLWRIHLEIHRQEQAIFSGETSVGQIKRTFEELGEFLFRCQTFPQGAVLLTGTGIVPPDNFTLVPGDRVEITISGIGVLRNKVRTV